MRAQVLFEVDVIIIEIGGIVGDIELLLFFEVVC